MARESHGESVYICTEVKRRSERALRTVCAGRSGVEAAARRAGRRARSGRPRFGGGSATLIKRAREGLPCASRRAGGVQTRGALAVFGQLVMMRGSQTGLLEQNDGAQEGKRMRERISGAEHGLQAVPVRSNKDSWPLARECRGRSALSHTVSRLG
jgi:hypothetical protein